MRAGVVIEVNLAHRAIMGVLLALVLLVGGSANAHAALVLSAADNPGNLQPLPAPVAGQPLYPRVHGRLAYGLTDLSWAEYAAGTSDPGHLLSGDEVGTILQAAGATLVRVPAYWPLVEPTKGAGNWADLDKFYASMIRHKVRPLWTLLFTPRWAVGVLNQGICNGNYCGTEPMPSAYGDLAAFAGRLAERYPLSAGIEFRNEPNEVHAGYLPVSAQQYTGGLQAVWRGVKAANPAMRVLGGALSNSPRSNLPVYLSQMLDGGAAQAMDGLSFHPYSMTPVASAFSSTFSQLRDVLAARGLLSMRLVPDEAGAATSRVDSRSEIFTETGQRDRLLYQYSAMNGTGLQIPLQSNIDAALFFTTVEPAPSSSIFGFGWLSRPDSSGHLTPKRVFCGFRREVGHKQGRFTGLGPVGACSADEPGYTPPQKAKKKKPAKKKKKKKKPAKKKPSA